MRKWHIFIFAALMLAAVGYYFWKPTRDSAPADWKSSSELLTTQIVPTLDTPIPANQTAIWCATFQLAWDHLKNKVNGEAIALNDAEGVADRLNASSYDTEHLVKGSYYANSGLAADDIVKTITREMGRQFPNHQVPAFGNDIVALAYAYLEADLKFTIPYGPDDLDFQDSRGNQTRVRAFGISKNLRSKDRWPGEQVDVFDSRKSIVIDLDKYSTPHQIILAAIRRPATLAEGWKVVSESINQANENRKLSPTAEVLIPKMNWAIHHNFAELERKMVKNGPMQGTILTRAFQSTRFALDEHGAKLKSEAVIETKKSVMEHLYFNRPYLIAMLRRGATQPYFLMWVDNAELMVK